MAQIEIQGDITPPEDESAKRAQELHDRVLTQANKIFSSAYVSDYVFDDPNFYLLVEGEFSNPEQADNVASYLRQYVTGQLRGGSGVLSGDIYFDL